MQYEEAHLRIEENQWYEYLNAGKQCLYPIRVSDDSAGLAAVVLCLPVQGEPVQDLADLFLAIADPYLRLVVLHVRDLLLYLWQQFLQLLDLPGDGVEGVAGKELLDVGIVISTRSLQVLDAGFEDFSGRLKVRNGFLEFIRQGVCKAWNLILKKFNLKLYCLNNCQVYVTMYSFKMGYTVKPCVGLLGSMKTKIWNMQSLEKQFHCIEIFSACYFIKCTLHEVALAG